ncbi:hypothetical protein FAF44_51430 [Nonomuraea sp. MG754425]|uniref:hypothetical protein n=1 Tax=Nonomuraea sp. MG754425 TaxID=2570319 RepID=UPI001F3B054A|nr:hypothetical protein [Nonomuraea sp. MG754425]MCF6476688.1 hypothetical protein [Nonomuraea sp. MG754425]
MRSSTRIATITLAGALALAALAAPAAAVVPGGIDGVVNALNGNSALNGNKVPICLSGVDAAGVGVKVPVGSPQTAGCTQH